MADIHVVKRDGTKELFDANKINLALVAASEGLPDQIAKVDYGNVVLPASPTGLLPVWDKLPSDYVRVSRISARDGRSLLGRRNGHRQTRGQEKGTDQRGTGQRRQAHWIRFHRDSFLQT